MSRFRVILEYETGDDWCARETVRQHVEDVVNASSVGNNYQAKVTHVVPLDPVDPEAVDKVVKAVREEAAEQNVPIDIEVYVWDKYLETTEPPSTVVRVNTNLQEDDAFNFWEVLSNAAVDRGLLEEDLRYRINISVRWKTEAD